MRKTKVIFSLMIVLAMSLGIFGVMSYGGVKTANAVGDVITNITQSKKYTALEDAFVDSAFKNGDSFELLQNSSIIKTTAITVVNKSFTLDLNNFELTTANSGFILSGTTSMTINDNSEGKNGKLSSTSSLGLVYMNGTGTFTMNSGTISSEKSTTVDMVRTVGTSGSTATAGKIVVNGGTITGASVAIKNNSVGPIDISGGTISSSAGTVVNILNNSIVTMTGGTIISNYTDTGNIPAVELKPGADGVSLGSFRISGGTITTSAKNAFAIQSSFGATVEISGTALITSKTVHAASGTVTVFLANAQRTAALVSITGGTVSNTAETGEKYAVYYVGTNITEADMQKIYSKTGGTVGNVFPNFDLKLTYNGNGSTSGTAPVDATPYKKGKNAAVLGADDLERVGYTFESWNTKANGNGTKYVKDNIIENIIENITLFAQWTANTNTAYTVKHLQQIMDSMHYDVVASATEMKTGKTGALTTSEAKTFPGFTLMPSSLVQKLIAADGSTVIELAYTRNTYEIYYNNGDTAIQWYSVQYGKTTPAYGGRTPTKPQDSFCTYIFKDFGAIAPTVVAEARYVATYTETPRTYSLTYDLGGGAWNGDQGANTYIAKTGLTLPTNLTNGAKNFAGWFNNSDFIGNPALSISATDYGNLTCYAKWEDRIVATISQTPQISDFSGSEKTFNVSSTPFLSGFTVSYQQNSAWLTTLPVNVGKYNVKIERAIDATYAAVSIIITDGLVINKVNTTLTWKEGNNEAASNLGNIVYTYSDSETGTFSSAKPTAPGTYWIKARIEGTENYEGLEETKSFTILATPAPDSKSESSLAWLWITLSILLILIGLYIAAFFFLYKKDKLKGEIWKKIFIPAILIFKDKKSETKE